LAAVVVLAVVLILLVFTLFLTLYFGWKASNGKMFRVPFIGSAAWRKVYEKKHNLEEEYYQSLTGGSKKLDESEEEEQLFDPLSTQPGSGSLADAGAKQGGNVDFANLSIKDKDLEKIKSIFAPPEEPEEEIIEEEVQIEAEEEIVEEELVVETPAPPKKELTPLEKLAILRKQQAAAAEQQKMAQQFQQAQPVRQVQLPVKDEPTKDDSLELLKAQAQGSRDLSPLEKLAALRKKQEKAFAGVVEAREEEAPMPAPRRTSFLNPELLSREDKDRIGMTLPKENAGRMSESLPQSNPTSFLSPLEHLAMKQRERGKPEPQVSDAEKARRMEGLLSKMKEKNRIRPSKDSINMQQDSDDEIF
jgi:hypothetical protein